MILALRALGLGDLLTVVPALRGLRQRFPGERVVLAAPAPLVPLVARTGAVDAVLPVASAVSAPPGALPWHGAAPRLAVNLHGRGPESARALAALGSAELWSYSTAEGPRWRDDEHEVHRWCRLLAWYGCPADPADLLLGTGSHDGPVVVHPGAASVERQWPAERFAAVARRLAESHPVVITGTARERHRAGQVAASAGLPADVVLAGRTDLADLADVVAAARLVVSGDTGVAHLASAYRTPSVLLFGPQPPSRWGPPDDGPHHLLWHRGPVTSITVEEVLAAVADRLGALSAHPDHR